jgi:hypothetical protein
VFLLHGFILESSSFVAIVVPRHEMLIVYFLGKQMYPKIVLNILAKLLDKDIALLLDSAADERHQEQLDILLAL